MFLVSKGWRGCICAFVFVKAFSNELAEVIWVGRGCGNFGIGSDCRNRQWCSNRLGGSHGNHSDLWPTYMLQRPESSHGQ